MKVVIKSVANEGSKQVRLIYLNGRPLGYLKSVDVDRGQRCISLTSKPKSARKYSGTRRSSSEAWLGSDFRFDLAHTRLSYIKILSEGETLDEYTYLDMYDPQKSLILYLPSSECDLTDERLDYTDSDEITVDVSYLRRLAQEYFESEVDRY